MPNWCDNLVTVVGTDATVTAFVDAVQAELPTSDKNYTALSLERICPTPPELLEADGNSDPKLAAALKEKYGASDWYSWRAFKAWGTKWEPEAEPAERVIVGGWHAARYQFASAWSSPIAGLQAASEQHPEVTVRVAWSEPGSAGAGYVVIQDGTVVEDFEVDVPTLVTEVVVDEDGTPVALLDAWDCASVVKPPPDASVAAVVRDLLRDGARSGPDPRALISCWAQDELPARAEDSLHGLSEARVQCDGGTAFASLTHAALTDALVGEGLAEAWYEALCESWEAVSLWLPKTLVERAYALAAAAPLQTLAAQIGACFDTSPEDSKEAAKAVLDIGVPAGPAVRLVGEMCPDLPPLEDLATVLSGTLLEPAALPESQSQIQSQSTTHTRASSAAGTDEEDR